MTTFVPGVQRLAVVRGRPSPRPPRSWTSIEIGKSWSFSIVFGCGLCSIRPLLRIAQRRAGRHLLAHEAVLGGDAVVRERILVEHVPELAVEFRPLVVAHLQHAVLDAERVVEVLPEVVLRELGRPAVEVAAVEQLDPLLLVRVVLAAAACRGRAAGRRRVTTVQARTATAIHRLRRRFEVVIQALYITTAGPFDTGTVSGRGPSTPSVPRRRPRT